jgi:predicted RNA-binding Zn-ribbon protein involved in translation (DUF1610 family)
VIHGVLLLMKSDVGGPVGSVAGSEQFRWGGVLVPPDRSEVPSPAATDTATAIPDVAAKENRILQVNSSPAAVTAKDSRLVSEITEIRAVAFRCGECQTIVSLPRIRWVNSPEKCPNCGSQWMHKPSTDSLLPEDESTYLYRIVSSFREALQRLITVKRDAAFHLLLEFDESPEQKNSSAETKRNGNSRF